MVFGVPARRDGMVTCYGHMISWISRKIERVFRSSSQSEAVALSNTCELTLFIQIVATEVLTGEYQISFLRRPEPQPLLPQFKLPHSPADMKRLANPLSTLLPALSRSSVSNAHLSSLCNKCGSSVSLPWSDVIPVYHTLCSTVDLSSGRPAVRALVLSDFANVIANFPHVDEKWRGKTNRLVSNHIRDLQAYMSVTYNSDPLNIADVGTKMQGDISAFNRFISSGQFLIGFLTRDECRKLPHSSLRPSKRLHVPTFFRMGRKKMVPV